MKYNPTNFRHIRNLLTLEASNTFLNAMILLHVFYCMSCWSQTGKTVLRPLEPLYKQALKILDRKSQRYYRCHILTRYNMLNYANLIIYLDIRVVFKVIHNAAPPLLRGFVQACTERTGRATRSTSKGDCSIPVQCTVFTQSVFSFKAINEWNNLPTEIKTHTNLHNFSCEVKKKDPK